MVEPIRENNPLEEKIKSNWTEIRAKYEEYLYNPFDIDLEEREEFLNIIKDMFLANLSDILKRYEHDPKNTDHAVHVTNSEPQAKSKIWKEARELEATASDIKEFTTSLVGARAVCKKKFFPRDLSKNPAIKWGNVRSSSHINNQSKIFHKIFVLNFLSDAKFCQMLYGSHEKKNNIRPLFFSFAPS